VLVRRRQLAPVTNGTKIKNLAEGTAYGQHPANGIFETNQGYRLQLVHGNSSVGVLLEHDGGTIYWDCTDDIDPSEIGVLIAGTFVSAAAALHGIQPVHGSTVQIAETQLALVAPSGVGKSTLTLALGLLDGVSVVTDDAFSFRSLIEPGEAGLVGGSRAIRVAPESAAALRVDNAKLEYAHRMMSKRLFVPPESSAADKPGGRPQVAVLARGDVSKPHRKTLDDRSAFATLMANRHPEWLRTEPSPAFARCVLEVIENKPVWQVTVPDSLDTLDETARWLRAQVAEPQYGGTHG
jgi:hypothetical protein